MYMYTDAYIYIYIFIDTYIYICSYLDIIQNPKKITGRLCEFTQLLATTTIGTLVKALIPGNGTWSGQIKSVARPLNRVGGWWGKISQASEKYDYKYIS